MSIKNVIIFLLCILVMLMSETFGKRGKIFQNADLEQRCLFNDMYEDVLFDLTSPLVTDYEFFVSYSLQMCICACNEKKCCGVNYQMEIQRCTLMEIRAPANVTEFLDYENKGLFVGNYVLRS